MVTDLAHEVRLLDACGYCRRARPDRLELIRFLQVSQTVTVHHGAMASLLGINALDASEATAVRIEDYADKLRGHHVIRLSASATTSPRPRRRWRALRDSFASGPLWRSRRPLALPPLLLGAEHGGGRS